VAKSKLNLVFDKKPHRSPRGEIEVDFDFPRSRSGTAANSLQPPERSKKFKVERIDALIMGKNRSAETSSAMREIQTEPPQQAVKCIMIKPMNECPNRLRNGNKNRTTP